MYGDLIMKNTDLINGFIGESSTNHLLAGLGLQAQLCSLYHISAS
jgi:hypothetical protein